MTKETSSHVDVSLGVGSMRIARSKIAAIHKSGADEEEAIREQWEKKHFLHRKYVPKSLGAVARGYRQVEAKRTAALRARRGIAALRTTETELRKDIETLRNQLVAVSRKLQVVTPEADPQAYNDLVVKSNALRAALTVKHDSLEKAAEKTSGSAASITSYLASLDEYRSDLAEQKQALEARGLSGKEQYFFKQLESRLTNFAREVGETATPVTKRSGGTVVEVTVNGKRGRFLLDTGAAVMTMSRAFADRLDLDLVNSSSITLTVADGRKIEAWSVILDHVQVGDARVDDVQAAVLPTDSTGQDIDGLLGMTFLEHFVVHLDGVNRQLILKRFAP